MYQVTAVYEGCEIGYGEGDGDGYAVEDCIDSIPQIYKDNAAHDDIRLFVRDSSGLVYTNTLTQYEIATN
jgi:hypothetical protein